MADFSQYFHSLLEAEGGFVDHPKDPGGATNKGITLYNWSKYGYDKDGDGDIDVDDLKLITEADAKAFYKPRYWDRILGDQIKSQQVANIIFDHGVNAGISRAVKMTQALLNVQFGKDIAIDGKAGRQTITNLNSVNDKKFHDAFKTMRVKYYRYLAGQLDSSDEIIPFFRSALKIASGSWALNFINGWLNRINEFPDLLKKNKGSIIGVSVVLGIISTIAIANNL